MSYRDDVLATAGLVGYWPLNEPSGTTAADLLGSLDGTITGATLGATGLVTNTGETSLEIDGFGQIVTLGTDATFDLDTFSFEAWFLATGTWAEFSIMVHETAAGSRGWAMVSNAGTPGQFDFDLELLTAGFARLSSTGWDVDTVWHMVVTYDEHIPRIYRNGVEVATGGSDYNEGVKQPASTVLAIGGKPSFGGAYLNGRIADVSFYSVALDAATVLAHYEAGIADPPVIESGSKIIMPLGARRRRR